MLEEILPAAIAAGLVAIVVTVLIERFGGVVLGGLGGGFGEVFGVKQPIKNQQNKLIKTYDNLLTPIKK